MCHLPQRRKGQVADDMLEGFMCSNCGIYFDEPHGFPVLCDGCWKTAEKEGRVKDGLADKCYQKSNIKEI